MHSQKKIYSMAQEFIYSEAGVSFTEYALVASLIAVVLTIALLAWSKT